MTYNEMFHQYQCRNFCFCGWVYRYVDKTGTTIYIGETEKYDYMARAVLHSTNSKWFKTYETLHIYLYPCYTKNQLTQTERGLIVRYADAGIHNTQIIPADPISIESLDWIDGGEIRTAEISRLHRLEDEKRTRQLENIRQKYGSVFYHNPLKFFRIKRWFLALYDIMIEIENAHVRSECEERMRKISDEYRNKIVEEMKL